MTDREWAEVTLELEFAFRGDLSEVVAAVYRCHLDPLGQPAVLAALQGLIRDGQEWLPGVGRIVAEACSQRVQYWLANPATRPPLRLERGRG